jgi:hypothetical protein
VKLIVDLEKKSLRMLENERSIFRGEYGADKLELYINKQLVDEYPIITALLSNGRKIGAYSTDSSYGSETIDGVTYTVASFTLSKQNGFTLTEGQMQITIWMKGNGKQEAIGNVTLNVINTTAFDDGDIIISGDVEGTLVNYKVELENLQSQVNTFNSRITNVETNKADKTELEELDDIKADKTELNKLKTNKADKTYVDTQFVKLSTDQQITGTKTFTGINATKVSATLIEGKNILINGESVASLKDVDTLIASLNSNKADKSYVDEKFNQLLGEGASETLDTIGEIAKAFEEHQEVTEAINQAIGNKADKTELNALETKVNSKADKTELFSKDYNDLSNKPTIPTKMSQLEQDVEIGGGVEAEDVMNIIEENSQEVDTLRIGTSASYDETSDNEVPTTKAVKTMLDNVDGGSNEIAEKIEIECVLNEQGALLVNIYVENSEIDFNKPFRINLYDSEANRESELQYKNGSYYNYLTITPPNYTIHSIIVNGSIYDLTVWSEMFFVYSLDGVLEMQLYISPENSDDYQKVFNIFAKENNLLTFASIHGSKRTYTTPLVCYEI